MKCHSFFNFSVPLEYAGAGNGGFKSLNGKQMSCENEPYRHERKTRNCSGRTTGEVKPFALYNYQLAVLLKFILSLFFSAGESPTLVI
jgi:hypothetical protein